MLRFVRRARDVGFLVDEIRKLLDLRKNHDRHGADVKQMALGNVAELRAKIQECIHSLAAS